MKNLFAALIVLASTTAFAKSNEPVPSRFSGLLGVTCTATIKGAKKTVITSAYNEQLQLTLNHVRVEHKAPKYDVQFASVSWDQNSDAKLQIFTVGNPEKQDDYDTVLNELYLEIKGKSARMAHGGEWLDIRDLTCDFDFAG